MEWFVAWELWPWIGKMVGDNRGGHVAQTILVFLESSMFQKDVGINQAFFAGWRCKWLEEGDYREPSWAAKGLRYLRFFISLCANAPSLYPPRWNTPRITNQRTWRGRIIFFCVFPRGLFRAHVLSAANFLVNCMSFKELRIHIVPTLLHVQRNRRAIFCFFLDTRFYS